MLELLVLEEQGYITIVDGGIVCQTGYLNEQLKRPDISEKELAEIDRLMELIFGEGKTVPLVADVKEVNALERIRLDVYMKLHKEEIMSAYEISDEEGFIKYMEGFFITQEIWLTEYRQKISDMESLSHEEFQELYPLGAGTPKDDMLFLSQMLGYTREERLLLLQELKKGKGISSKKLAEIVGGTYKRIGYESARISMAYQGSRVHMWESELMATMAANGVQQLQTTLNMVVMPMGLQVIHNEINPPPSNMSLDPRVGMDLQEIQINKGYPIETIVPGGASTADTKSTENYTNDVFAHQKYKYTLIKQEVAGDSKPIISGEDLKDKNAINALTSDGSDIGDWFKMESNRKYLTEYGEAKVHFYKNMKTGEISSYDAKFKISKPKDFKTPGGYDFWIIDLDKDFIPIGPRY